LEKTVADLIHAIGLQSCCDDLVCHYSGGNKRKLSLGMAILGKPHVFFIDEASSGLDAIARRRIWEVITNVGRKRSVVITTHSMEEAEALCTRVGILNNGRFSCIGSIQSLKNSTLDNYILSLQCLPIASPAVLDEVQDYILNQAFKGSVLLMRQAQLLRFSLLSPSKEGDAPSVNLGATFAKLHEIKMDSYFFIEDYSLSQYTLDQVFLNVAVRDGANPLEI